MNTLDTDVFTSFVCPYLTGKIIDDILLVNKHLYNLYWKIEEGVDLNIGGRYVYISARTG